jgi:hypothetical protein
VTKDIEAVLRKIEYWHPPGFADRRLVGWTARKLANRSLCRSKFHCDCKPNLPILSGPSVSRIIWNAAATLINIAKRMAGHSNVKTTELYDRRDDEVSFSEIERVGFKRYGPTGDSQSGCL